MVESEPDAPEGATCGTTLALHVYSYRRGNASALAAIVEDPTMPPNLLTPKDLFFNKVAKAVGTVFPAPYINKRRPKNPPPGSPPPRRSRRQAGLCAETIQTAHAQTKKEIMRSLGHNATQECL